MAAAAPALLITSALVGAAGSIQQSRAQQNAAEFNAKLHAQNAVLQQQQADEQEDRFRRRARFLRGQARVAAGDFTGSALDVLEDNALNLELDAATIRHQGVLNVRNSLSEHSLQRSRASAISSAMPLSASTALLGPLTTGFSLGTFGSGGNQ